MEPRHQIKRLAVDLRVPDQQIATELQQELSVFCRTQLSDVLQESFDSVAPDRYVRIDRMVLTLPSFQDGDELRSKLAERVREALQGQLAEALDFGAATARSLAGPVPDAADADCSASFALPYQAADTFMHVLRHGIAPWHGMLAVFDDVVAEVIALLHTDTLFSSDLRSFLFSSDVMLRRFILQIPLTSQQTIMALISDNDEAVIRTVDHILDLLLQAFDDNTAQAEEYRLYGREIGYGYLLKGIVGAHQFQLLLEEVLEKLSFMASDSRKRTALSQIELNTVETLPAEWRAVFHHTIASFTLPKESHSIVSQDTNVKDFTTNEGRNPTIPEDDAESVAKKADSIKGLPWVSQVDVEEFHISNAGLVLLVPFFSVVFKDLGYLDKKGDFISEDERARAVHFSQYLVTGIPHPPELNLTLNKIICGMQVDTPVARFVDLTATEHEAAHEVIDSALGHWSALKRTSAPVFQETFLQHQGILTFQGSSWQLRIERETVDIMLDTLPWTISIIKHPWMQQPVMVEW